MPPTILNNFQKSVRYPVIETQKLKLFPPVYSLVCLFLAFSLSGAEAADLKNATGMVQTAETFSEIIEMAKPAVVYIQVKKKKKEDSNDDSFSDLSGNNPTLKEFFGDRSKKENNDTFFSDTATFASGSGFIFNSNGYILTNNHVVTDAVEITVIMADKTKHAAKLIGTDKKTDIGLIKIDGKNLPVVPLGNSDSQKAGAWVLAIGSPFEFIQTATAGIISATGRNTLGITDYENFIQTDAAINPGNSGGPLINIEGKVIGINTAFLTKTGGYMGIGFAIPINIAKIVSEQLLKDGKVTRAWLGVGLKDADADQLAAQGLPSTTQAARVVEIEENSSAQQAGLQKGDIIMALNHTPITGAADLRNRISLSAPSSAVTLTYYRNATESTIKVSLGTL